MLKELKAPQKDSQAWCSESDRLQMAEDTLAAVRRVRREVVDCMRMLMKFAKVNLILCYCEKLQNLVILRRLFLPSRNFSYFFKS